MFQVEALKKGSSLARYMAMKVLLKEGAELRIRISDEDHTTLHLFRSRLPIGVFVVLISEKIDIESFFKYGLEISRFSRLFWSIRIELSTLSIFIVVIWAG